MLALLVVRLLSASTFVLPTMMASGIDPAENNVAVVIVVVPLPLAFNEMTPPITVVPPSL
jgi:hypothetical protein